MHVDDSPYNHAYLYSLELPDDLAADASAEVNEPQLMTTNFGLQRLRTHSPRMEKEK